MTVLVTCRLTSQSRQPDMLCSGPAPPRIYNTSSDSMPNPVDTLLSRRIEQLPSETRTKLRSTQILTSIPQIISELLQNSLDAGARHIEIGVDEEWTCWVQDDGVGISKEGLSLIGKGSEDGRYGE
jgi:hypothetical protein